MSRRSSDAKVYESIAPSTTLSFKGKGMRKGPSDPARPRELNLPVRSGSSALSAHQTVSQDHNRSNSGQTISSLIAKRLQISQLASAPARVMASKSLPVSSRSRRAQEINAQSGEAASRLADAENLVSEMGLLSLTTALEQEIGAIPRGSSPSASRL